MNKMILPLAILACFLCIGCDGSDDRREDFDEVGFILKGTHKIRKMSEQMGADSKMSAGFFLVMGEIHTSTKIEKTVTFAWEMNDGTYAISTVPLNKIRVKFDDSAKDPKIQFNWRSGGTWWTYQGLQKMIESNVHYVMIITKESDWPIQVNLPMNTPK